MIWGFNGATESKNGGNRVRHFERCFVGTAAAYQSAVGEARKHGRSL
jgi:hypothetical protein